jgi:hypothetical protein
MFEAMSGLKINFLKSEVMLIIPDDEKKSCMQTFLVCQVGDWPIEYLEVPVCGSSLHVTDMAYLSDKIN